MVINLQISISSITEDFVAKAYEVDNAGNESEVGSFAVPAPHTTPQNISFTSLDRIIHVVKLLGDPSGIEYNKYDGFPQTDIVNIFDFIRFKIGDGQPNTPIAGSNGYTNPIMQGLTKDDYVAIGSGIGPALDGEIIDNDPVNGGFTFTDPAQAFGDKDEWTILRKPTVIRTPVNDSVVGKLFGPTTGNPNIYVDVTNTLDYVPTHLRKIIRLAGVNANYRFTSANVPPVGYMFRITNYGSYGALTPYPKVTFQNAPAKYGNATITAVPVPLGSVIECEWDGTIWNLTLTLPIQTPAPTFLKGYKVVGDVSSVSTTVPIVFPGAVANADYHISYTIIGNGTPANDNNTTSHVLRASITTFGFNIFMGEINPSAQNIAIDWMITVFP